LNRRNHGLAGHDLAHIKEFLNDYKFGNLQFLKSGSPVFYILWKAGQFFAVMLQVAGSFNVAHLFRGEAVLVDLATENASASLRLPPSAEM
jgi:hypothetical protein